MEYHFVRRSDCTYISFYTPLESGTRQQIVLTTQSHNYWPGCVKMAPGNVKLVNVKFGEPRSPDPGLSTGMKRAECYG